MRYKNIIFDFGNVIGTFQTASILKPFCRSAEDFNLLSCVIFKNWGALDAGMIDYEENARSCIELLPDSLKETGRAFLQTGCNMSARSLPHGILSGNSRAKM